MHHTLDSVLEPFSKSFQSSSMFGDPDMLTAMPTIAIGSNLPLAPLGKSCIATRTFRPVKLLSRPFAQLSPGPILTNSTSSIPADARRSASKEVTESQLTGCAKIMSMMTSESDIATEFMISPLNVEARGAMRSEAVGTLMPLRLMSESTSNFVKRWAE